MAGDWIKMRTGLGDERATLLISELTGLDVFAVIGRLHAIWSWAGRHTKNGKVTNVTPAIIDRKASHNGFSSAMIAAGWLETIKSGDEVIGVKFPRFDKYNASTEKKRASDAARQRKHREKKKNSHADVTRDSHASHALRREETRGDERREENSIRDRTDRPIGAGSGQSPMDVDSSQGQVTPPAAATPPEPRGEPLDVSEVDWDLVVDRAVRLAKKVPPHSPADRRQWFKFAVLVEVGMFSEHWLLDAAEAVVNAPRHDKNRQAHLVAVLKSKAAEDGTSPEMLLAILRRIEIPAEVWKRNVMQVKR